VNGLSVSEEVTGYLRSRLGDGLEVTSCRRTYPGISRETYLVETTNGGFVVRVDPPGGGIVPLPLRREYEVYRRLRGTDVPVAEALWYDDDPAWFNGRPRMVRALVEGSASFAPLEPQAAAIGYAEALGRVHATDWAALGMTDVLGEAPVAGECAAHEIDTWWATWERVRLEPDPQLRRVVQWLAEQRPRDEPVVALLKGNNGVGEELWRDGRIVAMSDWELASIGDPASDWAFSQGVLALGDPGATLAAYERVTGFAIPEHNLAWYRLWTLVKVVICGRSGLRGFCGGRDPRPTLAAFGLGSGTLALHTLARLSGTDVTAAAAAISPSRTTRGGR
jgi:aminoglycoside phosphotransferase (APT) family kinase protein